MTSEHCYYCGTVTAFAPLQSNLREARCQKCRASKRNSDVARVIIELFAGPGEGCPSLPAAVPRLTGLKVYEAGSIGHVNRSLRALPGYVCSEYLDGVPRGESRNGTRCEDLTALTFPDATFDLVVSQDVFEHVHDPWAAFREVRRVLKPGGYHVFTVPCHPTRPTQTRAVIAGGDVAHVRRPIYHQDWLRKEQGALVFVDYGGDLPILLRRHGFDTAVHELGRWYEPGAVTWVDDDADYAAFEARLKAVGILGTLKYNSVVFAARAVGPPAARSSEPPAEPAPAVSVVIPLFNQSAYTKACLATLAASATADTPFEVVAVDNGSTDDTPAVLAEAAALLPHLRVVTNPTNLGFARACNQGVRAARGKYAVLLNNDTEVDPGWLRPMIDILDRDDRVGAVGGLMLHPDRTVQLAGFYLTDSKKSKNPFGVWLYCAGMPRLPAAVAGRPFLSQLLMGACLTVRTADYLALGGFDEGYYNGYEDFDFCLRLAERGRLLVTQPATRVLHHGGYKDPKGNPERFVQYAANRRRFFERWLGRVKQWGVQDEQGVVGFAFPDMPRPYAPPSLAEPPRC